MSSFRKAEEGGIAVATSTDDNAADGGIGSAIIKIMIETLHQSTMSKNFT